MMSSTRAINMQKRRDRILAEARSLLARQGFEALNLRDLAEVSGVSVPTIYNLIGNKAQVLQALLQGAFENYEVELQRRLPCSAAEFPVHMADTLIGLIAADEQFYRASVLANERLESHCDDRGDLAFRRDRIRVYMADLYQYVSQAGLLRGDIGQDLLVEQMLSVHQVAMRDWAHRLITLEEFRTRSLKSFYVTLASDAVGGFRKTIIKTIRAL